GEPLRNFVEALRRRPRGRAQGIGDVAEIAGVERAPERRTRVRRPLRRGYRRRGAPGRPAPPAVQTPGARQPPGQREQQRRARPRAAADKASAPPPRSPGSSARWSVARACADASAGGTGGASPPEGLGGSRCKPQASVSNQASADSTVANAHGLTSPCTPGT